MRIGLAGLGRIGTFHLQTLLELPVVETIVVTDAMPRPLARAAAEYAAEPVDTYEGLLEAGVDGVVIATSTDTHPAFIAAAVRAGLPAFCEKPVAMPTSDGIEVQHRAHDSGVEVQIGFPRRFDQGFAAARAAVSSGELGWLTSARATTLDPAPPPPAYVATSGGIFRDCSIHDFDAIRWVTGREVDQVYATGSNRGEPFFRDVNDVDTAAALLTLDDGTLALVSNTRYNARGYDVRLELHGSRDSIGVGHDPKLPLRSVEPGAALPDGEPYLFFMDRFRAAFKAELHAFTEVVARTRPSPCTIADALEASWVAEACTKSLRQRRSVSMEEIRP